MRKNILNSVLFVSIISVSSIALMNEAKAYDAYSGGYSYSVRNINGEPEDIGIGENVTLQSIETNYKNGVQAKVYKGADGAQYTVNIRDDGSYNVLKNGVQIKEGNGAQVSAMGMTPEYLGMVQKSFYGASVDMNGYSPSDPQATADVGGTEGGDAAEGGEATEPGYNDGSADGDGFADGPTEEGDLIEKKMTVTTTTNENGEVNTQTKEQNLIGGGEGGDGTGTGASPEEEKAADDAEEAAEKVDEAKKAEEKKEKEDAEKYDGLYNGRHIIPDIMAMHCKIKGEDVAKDPQLFVNCIKQYVSEMNNSNATAKAEAEKEYQFLKYKFLTDAGATAITKSQAVDNHEETMNKHNEAHSEMKTESDDNKSITASLSFVTNMMNDIRELQVEQLKYMVVSGIEDLDPSVIMDEEEPEEEKKEDGNTSGGAGDPEFNSTDVKVEIK